MTDSESFNTSGPEFAPLKSYIKAFKIKLTILDKNDNIIKEVKLDYGNHEHRKYLGKLSYWAWTEGHIVETARDE